jgi:protoheme IX farnesyltransferase
VIKKIKYNLRLFTELTKVTITLPVTFLSFIGYALANKRITIEVLWVCFGVFLLAGAASVINQIIEFKYDNMMERTQKRPIPSGRISLLNAALFAIILTIFGVLLLWPISKLSVILGILNLVWYLGVYTVLKRFTALAVIPGSLTGAIPLLIGWVAGNGYLFNPVIMLLGFFVFMWQIPHFWLLMFIYGKEYEIAGYPTLFRVFNDFQIRLWTLCWIIATAIVPLSLIYFGVIFNLINSLIIVALSLFLIFYSAYLLLYNQEKRKIKIIFHLINLFMIAILIIKYFDNFKS